MKYLQPYAVKFAKSSSKPNPTIPSKCEYQRFGAVKLVPSTPTPSGRSHVKVLPPSNRSPFRRNAWKWHPFPAIPHSMVEKRKKEFPFRFPRCVRVGDDLSPLPLRLLPVQDFTRAVEFYDKDLGKKERSFVDGALPLMGGKTMFGLADVFRRGKRRTWWLFAGTRLQGECRPAGLSIFGYSTQHGENKLTWSIFCADVSWIRFIEPGTTTTTELTRCNSSFATNYNWSYYFRFSHCFWVFCIPDHFHPSYSESQLTGRMTSYL